MKAILKKELKSYFLSPKFLAHEWASAITKMEPFFLGGGLPPMFQGPN